jgi:hypothetical protein
MRTMNFALILAGLAACLPAWGGDIGVGVSLIVDEPGLYGRVDIGNVPPPVLVYRRPVVVVRPPPTVVVAEPLYLHVPPGHARNWRRHCHEYDACGRPVYFVQNRWYNEVYVPARRNRSHHQDREREHLRGEDHDRGAHGRGNPHDHGEREHGRDRGDH